MTLSQRGTLHPRVPVDSSAFVGMGQTDNTHDTTAQRRVKGWADPLPWHRPPALMDVDLHPQVMDARVSEAATDGVERVGGAVVHLDLNSVQLT